MYLSDSTATYDLKHRMLATRSDTPKLPDGNYQPEGIILFHAILPFITLILLLVRNYSRFFFIRVKPGWDDVLLNLGWLSTAIIAAMMCLAGTYGMGKHVPEVLPMDRMYLLKVMWFGQTLYLLANFLIKNAFFVFYLRLASHQAQHQLITKSLIVVNTLIFLIYAVSAFFICTPVEYFWTKAIKGVGFCHDIKAFYLANACLNMIMDLATLVLPIPIIFGSPTLSFRKKVKISSLFWIGCFTCVASAMRIPTLISVTKVGGDFTYHLHSSSNWTVTELNVAILVACIPAIKPFVCSLLGRPTSTTGSSRDFSNSRSLPDHRGSHVTAGSTAGKLATAGIVGDSWEMRDHQGEVKASVSVTVPRKSASDSRSGARAYLPGGDHILLEDTVTVDIEKLEELSNESGSVREVAGDGRWEMSHENIVLQNGSDSARN